MSPLHFPTLSWRGVFGLQISARYVLYMSLLCAVSLSSFLAASSFFCAFILSSTCPELRTSRQGVQSEAVTALFPTLPTLTFAFEVCAVEMKMSEFLAGGRKCR